MTLALLVLAVLILALALLARCRFALGPKPVNCFRPDLGGSSEPIHMSALRKNANHRSSDFGPRALELAWSLVALIRLDIARLRMLTRR